MVKRNSGQRPQLIVSRAEAKERITAQIEKAAHVPDQSVNDNEEARRWYEFTAELLRQLFTTDEITDEFTGRSSVAVGSDDITTGHYLKRLLSISDRLDLYPETVPRDSGIASSGSLANVERLIGRFHNVAKQLRERYADRPTIEVADEYDVQDLLHALLRIDFDDVRPEEWTPSYAGLSSRMDFLLKREGIVLEVKKTRPKLTDREITEQLAVDILRYRSHPDCKLLVCFVYDPEERIRNPRGLEQDLAQADRGMAVKVYVALATRHF